MAFEWVVEKFKQHRLEVGIKIGRQQGRAAQSREVRDWYERQQAAFRAGIPFDEPPPVYYADTHANGAEGG